METIDIFIGARAGSERVRNKNTRILGGKPLISHTLDTALNIKNIQNIVVSSNDPAVKEIVSDYKDIIYIDRPNEISTSISQDIEWILHVFETVNQDIFIKLPPTSPFRKVDFIEKSVEEFTNGEKYDSARAVALCKEHPGKMWVIDSGNLVALETDLVYDSSTSMHAGQYQDLPEVYVQTSSLEISRSSSVKKYKTREGKKIKPIICEGTNAFAIDYESDFFIAEEYIKGNLDI